MTNIEQIKSEDLAAQVQDANPGNFAIEQEVAQLVGATVPAPTQPSADDARELGAQLLVFLRRALLPIQTALRTALAAIYANLDSRCTDYTPAAYASYIPRPYDPMGTPPTPRTVANLLTALTAFSPRKISNGSAPNDGIPDGTSLAHILLGDYSSLLKLVDDNNGWTLSKRMEIRSLFPNCTYVDLGCSEVNVYFDYNGGWILGSDAEYHMPNLKKIYPTTSSVGYGHGLFNGNVQTHDIYLPELEEIVGGSFFGLIRQNSSTNLNPFSIYMPKLKRIGSGSSLFSRYNDSTLGVIKVQVGKIDTAFQPYYVYGTPVKTPNLIDWEFGQGTCANINLQYWAPTLTEANTATFLQNFRDHIALRLTANGSGLTLTLSQAVRNAIHAAESTYGIENIIVTQKGWTISPAPN